ncbi:MAG TPA: dihydrodipicolinate synthase family protein [Rectinemataceae bacterium]
MKKNELPTWVKQRMRDGCVIPAMPLALDSQRRFDPRRQRVLTRYYAEAGAGGLAVGVHSTQFAIRDPKHGLFEPVLKEVSAALDEAAAESGRPLVKIGGICGRTDQALAEADFLIRAGYHAGLLSLGAFKRDSFGAIIAHVREVAEVIPIVGFYLQPAVGGLVLPYEFWRLFAEVENVLAIKIAPFNRYRTIDVIRAVCDSGREGEIALYTGNDDSIIVDLLTEFRFATSGGEKRVRIVGGLLGQWCVWTKKAVEMHSAIREAVGHGMEDPAAVGAGGWAGRPWLSLAQELTDANAAIFDAANGFAGCIPGIHEILRRQGLLEGTWCLDPEETMSGGQAAELDRVCAAYPHLADDEFVREGLSRWLR